MLRMPVILFLLTISLFSLEMHTFSLKGMHLQERGSTAKKQNNLNKDDANMNGYVKIAYQYSKYEEDEKSLQGAIGGALHFGQKLGKFVDFETTLFTSQPIFKDIRSDNVDIPLFNSQGNGYFLLGELYATVHTDNTALKIGRQIIDTPFVQEYDIAIIPNVFEGISLHSELTEDILLEAFWFHKMAGGIYTDIPESFENINDDKGIFSLGILFHIWKNITNQVWIYQLATEEKYSYIDETYTWEKDDSAINLALQYSYQTHENTKNSSTIGAKVSVSLQDEQWQFSSAANKVLFGKMDNGIGNGPFFVNNAYLGLADAGELGSAFNVAIGYQPTYFEDNLHFEYIHSYFHKNDKSSILIDDFEMSYTFQKHSTINLSASHIERDDNEENYDTLQAVYVYQF